MGFEQDARAVQTPAELKEIVIAMAKAIDRHGIDGID